MAKKIEFFYIDDRFSLKGEDMTPLYKKKSLELCNRNEFLASTKKGVLVEVRKATEIEEDLIFYRNYN
jgi:hypothetical protein